MRTRSRLRPRAAALLVLVGTLGAASDAAAREAPVPRTHVEWRKAAEAAYTREDFAAARDAFTAALKLRPDSPRYLHNIAALSARLGKPETAFAHLEKIAALGVSTPIDRDPDFASLRTEPRFARILRAFAENRQPHGEPGTFALLPGRTGIIEGVAFRASTGDVFLGDVHHRCIWRRDRAGRVTQFNADHESLFGIFGLAIDERRNALWATMAAVPEMRDFDPELKGFAALAEFDLTTAELRRVVSVPADGQPHGLGDLTVADDGTVYATDSLTPAIWMLLPGEEEPAVFATMPEWISLQGLAIVGSTLVVADYGNGLYTVNLATRSIQALDTPPDTTLVGVDGLMAIPGGLVLTQNGTIPERILHVTLAPDTQAIAGVRVLASGGALVDDLTLLTLIDERPTVVAGSGWKNYDPQKAPQPPPHDVRLLQVDVLAPSR